MLTEALFAPKVAGEPTEAIREYDAQDLSSIFHCRMEPNRAEEHVIDVITVLKPSPVFNFIDESGQPQMRFLGRNGQANFEIEMSK